MLQDGGARTGGHYLGAMQRLVSSWVWTVWVLSVLIGFPSSGTWHELVNSQATQFLGTGPVNTQVIASDGARDGLPANGALALAPYSVIVFSKTGLPGPPHGILTR